MWMNVKQKTSNVHPTADVEISMAHSTVIAQMDMSKTMDFVFWKIISGKLRKKFFSLKKFNPSGYGEVQYWTFQLKAFRGDTQGSDLLPPKSLWSSNSFLRTVGTLFCGNPFSRFLILRKSKKRPHTDFRMNLPQIVVL